MHAIMNFVKREDNIMDEDSYKHYIENLQKSHQIETMDYQHTSLSREQFQQAVQSSITHNFPLPISQMSTLMLKTNQLARSFNFNDLPIHLQKNLSMELDLLTMPNEMSQSLRHDELLSQNLSRNFDASLVRTLSNELELQNSLNQAQNLHEQDIRNISADLNQNLNRLNELSQNLRDIPHEFGSELDLSVYRQIIDSNTHDERRSPLAQYIDNSILEQHLAQRLDQNMPLRLELSVERLDHTSGQRLDQRLANSVHEQRQVEQNEHLLPLPFHIKSEQDDDGYLNVNHQLNNNNLNGDLPEAAQNTQSQSLTPEQIFAYNSHIVPALNPIDLYSRSQNYIQGFANMQREDPQNLVVYREFEKRHDTEKKDLSKVEEPKENLKPNDHNKIYCDYSNGFTEEDNDLSSHNKVAEELMNIKGEYVCYRCTGVFPSKRALKQHTKSCEQGDNDLEKLGKFSCSQCAYRCQSPAILKIHERTHTGEKPYACTFCDYKSGQKNNVAKHILVHMKQKPFRCQYCDYRCAQKNNLVVHERTHTGYKPFACPYCDYRTVQKPNLVKHMYLHTDQKPFSCDMCSYRCVQKTNLTKHKQRHLAEKECEKSDIKVKPYKPRHKSVTCPLCSYKCVQKASLEKHMQFKHQSDMFESVIIKNDSDEVHNLSVKKDFLISDKDLCTSGNMQEPQPLQS